MSFKIFLTKEERIERKRIRKEKRLQKKLLRKQKLSTRKWVLPAVIISVIVYAALDVYLQVKTQMEISPTLTTCWFTFWAVELWNLASITKKKVDVDYETGYTENLRQLDRDEQDDEVKETDEQKEEVTEDIDNPREG